MVEGGMKCVKYLLFLFNLLFVLAAIGLIAIGAYVQIALKEYFDVIGGKFSAAAALLIAVGVFIFFIASFGCFGAYRENRVCVLIFSSLLIFIFILEIAAGIAAYVYRNQVQTVVEDYMTKTISNPNIDVWNAIQKDLKCCGINNASDWTMNSKPIPQSCCVENQACNTTISGDIYTKGCLSTFTDWVKGHVAIVGGVGIGFAFIQLVGILFSCCLARAIKKEYEVV